MNTLIQRLTEKRPAVRLPARVPSLRVACFLLGALSVINVSGAQDAESTREITQITENLYRFQNLDRWIQPVGGHMTAFLVTEEGIVLADPINPEAAAWLKTELDQRFDVPVKYVLYSHYHFDHATGGAEFVETATYVGHENMAANLEPVPQGAPLEIGDQLLDRNEDNLLQPDEAFFISDAPFERIDINNDGGMSNYERRLAFNPLIRAPDITYSDRLAITIGSQTVETGHYTQYHSSGMSYVHFKEQNAIYVVDIINLKTSPNTRWGETGPDEWIDAIKAIEALDFDIVIAGHGPIGNKSDVTALRQFFEDVLAAVEVGMQQGQSLETLQQTIKLEQYSDWQGHAARLPDHIANAYQYFQRRDH